MKEIEIEPQEIGIWVGQVKVHEIPLEKIVQKNGWRDIPRVPVFTLPEGYPHKYVIIDGHGRHNTAIKTNNLLPCNVYERDEEIDVVKDKLAPFRYQNDGLKLGFYNKIVRLYEMYQNQQLTN